MVISLVLCRYYDAISGLGKTLVMFGLLPLVYRSLARRQQAPNDFLLTIMGVLFNLGTSP
jgi:hypothetical protein